MKSMEPRQETSGKELINPCFLVDFAGNPAFLAALKLTVQTAAALKTTA